ncbi:MAG: Na+/H+ antiporter subunit B [Phycisphaerae bacterium]|nr:Na+/H+ antiporter subunit B [Phycisphaerae bacterium]
MKSTILITASRILHPLLLMFAVFLLLRGHNEPGGGFAGGLVAASAYVLHAMANGAASARRALRVSPHVLVGAGLLAALAAGLFSLFVGEPFLTGAWANLRMPGSTEWSVGTPLLFDAGVFLVVVGITMLIILSMAEN